MTMTDLVHFCEINFAYQIKYKCHTIEVWDIKLLSYNDTHQLLLSQNQNFSATPRIILYQKGLLS